MNGQVIKSFLVGLGFGVDDSSLAKFNKAVESAAIKVTALYATIQVTAGAIFHSISQVAEGFEQMGYEYRLIAPAINKTLLLRQEMLKAYSQAGVNIGKVVQQSVLFNFSLAKTQMAFKAIYGSVASRFIPLLTKQMDVFRKTLYANLPKIQQGLEKFIQFVFKAFEMTVQLGTRVWSILQRVYDFFVQLDKATDGWSTIVFGLIAAWKILNLGFLATPLGMLLVGFLAILALWDDFQTWKEGGKSLFDWSYALPIIDAVKGALLKIWDVWKSIVDVVANVVLAIYQLFQGDTKGALDSLTEAGKSLMTVFGGLWEMLKAVLKTLVEMGSGVIMKAIDKVKDIFGFGGNQEEEQARSRIQKNPNKYLGVGENPLGTDGGGSQSNMNVNQQTQINLMGTASTEGNSNAVAAQQSRVNFDMTRNLRSPAR